MQRFLKAYAGQDLVVRTRAQNLFWVQVVLGGALLVVGVLSSLRGATQLPLLAFSITALFVFCLWVLRSGRYTLAANLTFVVLAIGSSVGTLTNRVGDTENDFFRLTAIFAMTTVLTTFFGYSGFLGVAMGVVGLATMGIILATPYPAEQMARTLADVQKGADPVTVTIVFLVMIAVASLGLFQTGRILHRNRESQQITEEAFRDVQTVVREAGSGLEVSRQVEAAAQTLSSNAVEIRSELEVLGARTKGLRDQAVDTATASTSLEAVQNDLRTRMDAQHGAIEQTSSALEEIDALFQTIASSSRAKKESLDGLGTQARDGERRLHEVAKAYDAMQRTAEEVLSVVQVIEDISARTNLLAMNASIEAAHAGEAGRGFAVVAEEIRKLAAETSSNSQSIRRTLDGNLAQVQVAVRTSRESQELLATMIRAFQDIQVLLSEQLDGMVEMGKGTQEILRSVSDLQASTGAVQVAAGSLEGAVSTNRRHASQFTETAEVFAGGVETLQRVAAAVGRTAHTVEDLGKRNRELVHTLGESLARVQSDMEARKARLG